MVTAIQDERYVKDEAYRQDVQERIAGAITTESDAPATQGTSTATALTGDALVSAVHSAAGGAAQFALAKERFSGGATADERAQWNDAVDRGDARTINSLLSTVNGRVRGTATSASGIASTANTAGTGFRSRAEMSAAMQDPHYRRDEAYRQDIQDRIAATAWL
jgi:SMC interacting uncharacterized protein involved in chromosome segregation